MSDKFLHFRTQSSYSMLESAIRVNQIVELANKNKMSAVCLSDRGNLFASLEFALDACKGKVQPIHGSILNIKFNNQGNQNFAEILLIAANQAGYQNLLKLVSMTFTKNERSICNHITFEDLTKHSAGIIALSGYVNGVIGKYLLEEKTESAKVATGKFKNLFGDRFYFEIMRHSLDKEKQIEAEYLKIANEYHIPLIATNNVLFSDISMHDSHDVLMCISQGKVRGDQSRKRVSNHCYFKSSNEMIKLFEDLPEAIQNTVHLARRCSFMVETRPPSLPNFTDGSISEKDMLKLESKKGLEFRLEQKLSRSKLKKPLTKLQKQEYLNRLDYELGVICDMDFAGYFLIVSDFIRWSKENNIAVGPGRGSGAGSIIAWTLQITDLDPIEFGLLFERFLNPERVSIPDFDIDFCQERREEVIAYVRSKYGDDRVGQIITFGKMQAKAVIKDVSRVLGLMYKFADYLTELVPFNAINPVTLSQAMADVTELKQAYRGKGLYNLQGEEELIQQVLTTSLVLEGLHRHASTHAAGIVIANESLNQIVPVYKDMNSDMLIVQYSMKYSELAGLVKFDFLGLQTLTVITKTLALLKDRDVKIDINIIPFDDKLTFDMLSNGLSTGVFQFESGGMKNALKKLEPDNVNDIIALGALYRPGPMDNIPTYIACKHKEQEADFLHSLLEPILRETYGVIIYQEQVMEIARKLSGYSLGAADLLRRAMGKKVKSEMDAQEEIFVSGAVKNNVSIDQAKSIFATVAKFAGYGFNKSHASAYGIISYQTAYLKANYPVEFLVACLNLEISNSDKINIYLHEARNFNIEIISPDINGSNGFFNTHYDGDKKCIIFALGAIKNVTINFGLAVSESRAKFGLFKSMMDFAEKIEPKFINRRLLENIIKAGCFDSLHSNRNSLLQSVPKIMAYSASYHAEKKSNQFSLITVNAVSENILLNVDDLPQSDLAYLEFDVLGLFLKNHPLSNLLNSIEKANIKTSSYIKNELIDGASSCKLIGVITKKDARMSARGRFVTLNLSDPDGIFEVSIFNEEVFKNYANLINIKTPVILHCEIFKDKGGLRISASRFTSIEEEIESYIHDIQLYPKDKQELNDIMNILKSNINPDKTNVIITLFMQTENDFIAKVNIPNCIYLNSEDLSKIQK